MVGVNSDGTVQCAGLPVDCSLELVCPTPVGGKSCLSGRLSDAQDSTSLESSIAPGSPCDGGAEGGPCELTLEVHDVLSFASDPAASAPLAHGEFYLDGCGRFRFEDMTPPGTGYAALSVDDAGTDYVLSAHFVPLGASQTVEQLDALAVRASTVQLWTDSAGSPFGLATFAEHGALFATFSKDGVPVSGVTITRNGSPAAAHDYYFSDPGADSRTTINLAQTMTGANGAALVTDSEFVNHSGTGSETGGCVWSEELADAIAGVVTVADINCN
jgi:hypothetical protein